MIKSKSVNENTTNSMGAAGHFLLSTGSGTTAKVFTRKVGVIEVKSGTVLVVSGKQDIDDQERADDYPAWVNETLEVGIHIVNFSECSLSGATFTVVHYGV